MSSTKSTGELNSRDFLESSTVWTIPDFRNKCRPKKSVTSPSFSLLIGQDTIEWKLILKSDTYFASQGQTRDCISLRLDVFCLKKAVTFNMLFEFCLLDLNGQPVEETQLDWRQVVTGRDTHLDVANFIPWRVLLGRHKELLPDGVLTVGCKLRTDFKPTLCDLRSGSDKVKENETSSTWSDYQSQAWSKQIVDDWPNYQPPDESNPDDGKLDDVNHASQLTSCLLNNSVCSDVILKCCGKSFKCHKSILAAKSPVFFKMFFADVKPVTLDMGDDMTPLAVEDLLSYFYTGQMRHLADNCLLLFAAALEYEVPELKEMAKKELVKKLTPENAVDFLVYAQKTGATELKKLMAEYIANS